MPTTCLHIPAHAAHVCTCLHLPAQARMHMCACTCEPARTYLCMHACAFMPRACVPAHAHLRMRTSLHMHAQLRMRAHARDPAHTAMQFSLKVAVGKRRARIAFSQVNGCLTIPCLRCERHGLMSTWLHPKVTLPVRTFCLLAIAPHDRYHVRVRAITSEGAGFFLFAF